MKVVGYISADRGLPLAAGCLNQSIDIKINTFRGKLLTPKLPKDYKNNSDNFQKRLDQPDSIINFNDSIDWGTPVSWPSGESNVTTFKIEIDIKDNNNIDLEKEKLSIETEKWIKRFLENLFAVGYNYGSTINQNSNKYINKFDYYVKYKGGGKTGKL